MTVFQCSSVADVQLPAGVQAPFGDTENLGLNSTAPGRHLLNPEVS